MTQKKFNINGKPVIITGGAGFLGVKHGEAISEVGGIPLLLDIDDLRLREAEERLRRSNCSGIVHSYVTDITSEKSLRETLQKITEEVGVPYGLINNAAIDPKFDRNSSKTPKTRLEFFPLEQWEKEIKVGLSGAFLCAKVFGAEMANEKDGVIINISSDLGLISPDQRIYRQEHLREEEQEVKPVTYSVIKHGLIGLTKYLATYWAMQGVRCNTLVPGGVYNNHPEEFVKKLTNLIPLGRMAKEDEYKSAIQFLASPASSYMTGTSLIMDGGRSVW